MKSKILIASGSRHTIPPLNNSPGVAHIIYCLAKSFDKSQDQIKVISKYHQKLEEEYYDKDIFLHPYISAGRKVFFENFEKLPFSYRIFKKKYGFTQVDRILYYTSLVKLAKQQQPDVVVTFMHFQLFTMLKKALPSAKHIYFFRSTDLKYRLGEKNIKFLLNNANGFLANTKAPIDELQQYKNVKFPCKTIYNAVLQSDISKTQLKSTRDQMRLKYDISENAMVLGFAGRFSEEKSLLELFKCVANYNEKQHTKPIHLVLAGDIGYEKMPNYDYFRKLKKIEQQSLEGQVHWMGWLPQKKLYQFYATIDYGLVLSKKSEGNSMFLLECLNYGKPVIATSIGGNKEVIKTNYNGYLIKAVGIEKQLDEILNFITIDENYKKLSRQAKNYVTEYHSVSKMIHKFHAFLENI